jgi:hypothetical protein
VCAISSNPRIWLTVSGGLDIGIIGFCLLMMGCVAICSEDGCQTFAMVILTVIMACYMLFQTAWFIIGVVILARSNGACVAEGSSLGVMMIIRLALFLLPMLTSTKVGTANAN